MKNTLWTRDIDLSATESFLATLSLKSGLPLESLYRMTLKSYEGYLAEAINPSGRNRFIQPVANMGRLKTAHGLRYCPKCLAEGATPYFRKKWRLSFSTACIKHGCFLLDRCPGCDASVNLYRCYFDDALEYCCKCGADLKNAPVEFLNPTSPGMGAIRLLYEVLDNGVFQYEAGYIYSFLFFDMVYQLGKIVLGHSTGSLDSDSRLIVAAKRTSAGRQQYLTAYPLHRQYYLFAAVIGMLEEYPKRLIETLSSASIRGSSLTKDMHYIPYQYESVVGQFDLSERMVSRDEARAAIRFLKGKSPRVYKMSVQKLLGTAVDLRKRRDIRGLFRKEGRFHIAR